MTAMNKRTLTLILAFFAVYTIWGSTYLAIRFALQGFPPFAMAGIRFVIAGGLMYGWLVLQNGFERPSLIHWRSALIIGCLLLVGGNGGVVWAEQTVPSGMVSLLVSVVPIWIALLDWVRPGGKAPSVAVCAGLIVGFLGVGLLIGPGLFTGAKTLDLVGTACVMLGSFSWSAGSIMCRHAQLPKNPLVSTAMEMLCGGAAMLAISAGMGEFNHFHAAQLNALAVGSLAYLVIFGSIIGFSAYVWLLKVVSPARVATYAYVNPVVAVLLGWLFAGETVSARTLIAAAIIIGAVAMITTAQAKSKRAETVAELEEELPGPAQGVAVVVAEVENVGSAR